MAYPAADYDCAYIYYSVTSMLVTELEANASKWMGGAHVDVTSPLAFDLFYSLEWQLQ